MTASPLSRAERVRDALRKTADWAESGKQQAASEALVLIPEGAIILTREEAEQVRDELDSRRVNLGSHLEYDAQPRRLNRAALALLSAGQPGQAEK